MNHRAETGATRNSIYEYVEKEYGTNPEFPWRALPLYSVMRRPDNKKWYAVIMNLKKDRLGLGGDERIDIMDIKCAPAMREKLLSEKGFLPAYHLNRKNWITVLLDGSVNKDTVIKLLDESYLVASGKCKPERTEPTSWLVPANPRYYDLEKAFEESDTILWKQSNSIIAGDIIYIYMASPYSCILYKCKAVEVDIPYEFDDGKVSMHKVMRLKRLHTFSRTDFKRDELKEHGIISVRGPRSVPYGLVCKLEKY